MKPFAKRGLAALLALMLSLSLLAAPASASSTGYSARTPLGDAYSDRADNIRQAVWSIGSVSLASGETFSFNDAVGPRTAEYGYVRADNGRGARVMGGGVAQVATTIYLALLNMGSSAVRFDELTTYGDRFEGNYVSSGDLAVVTDYSAGTDFAFTNLTGGNLSIELWLSDSFLYCHIEADRSGLLGSPASSGNWFSLPRGSATILVDRSDDDLVNNISLAADSIHGTVLTKGDLFSFNDIVGPRTAEYGYEVAVNGRGARVRGGGMAQVASAVWLAAKNLGDVSIVEKSTYGKRYNQNYVASSSDAIVTDYSAGTDFSFRYTGSSTLEIYTWYEDGALYCQIF